MGAHFMELSPKWWGPKVRKEGWLACEVSYACLGMVRFTLWEGKGPGFTPDCQLREGRAEFTSA